MLAPGCLPKTLRRPLENVFVRLQAGTCILRVENCPSTYPSGRKSWLSETILVDGREYYFWRKPPALEWNSNAIESCISAESLHAHKRISGNSLHIRMYMDSLHIYEHGHRCVWVHIAGGVEMDSSTYLPPSYCRTWYTGRTYQCGSTGQYDQHAAETMEKGMKTMAIKKWTGQSLTLRPLRWEWARVGKHSGKTQLGTTKQTRIRTGTVSSWEPPNCEPWQRAAARG
jgi:hypothetical protein